MLNCEAPRSGSVSRLNLYGNWRVKDSVPTGKSCFRGHIITINSSSEVRRTHSNVAAKFDFIADSVADPNRKQNTI